MSKFIPLLLLATTALSQIVDPVKQLPGPPRQPPQSSGEAITLQPAAVKPGGEPPKPVTPTTPAAPEPVQANRLNFVPVTTSAPPPPTAPAVTNAGPWSAATPPNPWQPAKPPPNPWETKPTTSPWK